MTVASRNRRTRRLYRRTYRRTGSKLAASRVQLVCAIDRHTETIEATTVAMARLVATTSALVAVLGGEPLPYSHPRQIIHNGRKP